MRKLVLLMAIFFSFNTYSQTLENDFSKEELAKFGGKYMTDLYLFLDSYYCSEDSYPRMPQSCIEAYLKELILIKKEKWAKHFYKESNGLYTKLNIMDDNDSMACDVTLEVIDLKTQNFEIYCDH